MSAQTLHVLVVEDNPGDVRLIREGFDRSSVDSSLTVVNDGKAALDYLYQRGEYASASAPDLTLLDLNVPKVSGQEILERIKTDPELRSMPVVILSGSGSAEDIHATDELGANRYYVKPVDPAAFMSLIDRIGESAATDEPLPRGEFADLDRAR